MTRQTLYGILAVTFGLTGLALLHHGLALMCLGFLFWSLALAEARTNEKRSKEHAIAAELATRAEYLQRFRAIGAKLCKELDACRLKMSEDCEVRFENEPPGAPTTNLGLAFQESGWPARIYDAMGPFEKLEREYVARYPNEKMEA